MNSDDCNIEIISKIETCFSAGSSNPSAHQMLLPDGRALQPPNDHKDVKDSAVLVLLCIDSCNEVNMMITERSHTLRHHPGQLSFPGGRCDETDESHVETALREAYEEVGLNRDNIKIVGRLSSLYVSVSQYLIHPVVAVYRGKPVIKENPSEVRRTMFLPLSQFTKDSLQKVQMQTITGIIDVPAFIVSNECVWGATAMIIAELASLMLPILHPQGSQSYNGDIDR